MHLPNLDGLSARIGFKKAKKGEPVDAADFSHGGALFAYEKDLLRFVDAWCDGKIHRGMMEPVFLPDEAFGVGTPFGSGRAFGETAAFLIREGFDTYAVSQNILARTTLESGRVFRVHASDKPKHFYPEVYAISQSRKFPIAASREDRLGYVEEDLATVLARDNEHLVAMLEEARDEMYQLDSDQVTPLFLRQRQWLWERKRVAGHMVTTPFVLRQLLREHHEAEGFQPPSSLTDPTFGSFAGMPLYILEPAGYPFGCEISRSALYVLGTAESTGHRAIYGEGFSLTQWLDLRIEGVDYRAYEVSADMSTWIDEDVVTKGRVLLGEK